ncbi:helix-turn-helix domain-containing protein [Paenibacillus sp. V4I7]|uniref:MerR family transcriptional regulator n=1 Tax=Paenibacillus sp. V4I7 TaxID=3042307 RepID=UPI002783A8BB|nr:MerR family transcriptional regulator [Paenibacillus sp. V4I7]MDQ0897668.1 DNA-binding transcriptional MerR regulator [Paenibacillus sp. V4I7]
MLKIGEFSKLSRVSIKTLRYYDAMGLLRPDVVDENNGYRYYSEAQLLTVKRIVVFKEQGFTLEQIIPFLEDHISPEVVKSRLTDKQIELHRIIEESKNQLNEINKRIHRVEESANRNEDEHSISIRGIDPLQVASIRDIVPYTQLCLLLDEVTQYVRTHGDYQVSSLIIIKHDHYAETDQVDLEVALPIMKNIPSSNRVKVNSLPRIHAAASLIHRCDPYGITCRATTELSSWISVNGYTQVERAPIREVYITPDQDIYGRMRLSELLIPIEPV